MCRRSPIEQWQPNFEVALGLVPETPRRVTVLRETDSTQDAARRMNARPGDVVVAWRQTKGRGRLGRTWEDTGEDGVAMTIVAKSDRPERLAIASAIAVACAVERACKTHGVRVAIKWPNDVLANDRKIAGVLIEQSGDHAFIGIGINVHQAGWPESLMNRAISLAQMQVRTDRLQVMLDVVGMMQATLTMSDEWLSKEFMERDCLCGTNVKLQCGDRIVRGRVLRVDPMQGLAIASDEAEGGDIWLPAATTTLLEWNETRNDAKNEISTLK